MAENTKGFDPNRGNPRTEPEKVVGNTRYPTDQSKATGEQRGTSKPSK